MGQLADGRRLADAVDADDKHDGRARAELQARVADVQHVHKDILQGIANFFRCAELALLHDGAELLDGLAGRFHADVGEDHALLKLLVKFFVCAG